MKLNDYRNFVKSRNERPLKIYPIIQVRWAPSQLISAISVTRQYESLVLHLDKITKDNTRMYSTPAKKQAQEMKNNLLDDDLLIFQFLMIDVLSLTSTQTKFYEFAGISVIGTNP